MHLPATPTAPAPDAWALGWDALAAFGTIIAAVVTVLAVLVAINSARTGRESAEKIAADDRAAAEAALRDQMTAEWNARRTQHVVDLLLKVTDGLAALRSHSRGTAQGREAMQLLRVLGAALPPQPVFQTLRDLLSANLVENSVKAQEETAALIQKVVDVG